MKTHTISNCLDANIEYEVFDNENYELTQIDYEHIQGFIKDGYNEGELLSDTDGRGWWKILK